MKQTLERLQRQAARAEGVSRSDEYTNDEMPKFPGEIPKYTR